MRPCFIHIPKAAGTSIKTFLYDNYGRANVYVENVWLTADSQLKNPDFERRFKAFGGHTPYEFYQHLTDVVFFAVVRDPLSRRQSEYAYIRRTPDHEVHNVVKDQSFTEFLLSPDRMANEQCRYLHPRGGNNTFESAREGANARRMFIGTLEKLPELMNCLSYRFEWQHSLLPRENTTMIAEKPEISPEARRIVAELDGEDAKLYEFIRDRF